MIDPEKRKAIYCLHNEGMGVRELSRRLGISTNTVMAIIDQKGKYPDQPRKDRITIDHELLARLYSECDGYVKRMHEKLVEEEGIRVSYSTLSRIVRETGLGQPESKRCGKVPDKPGAEIQHDTSPYKIRLGDSIVNLQGSLLYFRFSKIRYLKFYRSFDRFKMKCFFHEALTFIKYTAPVCIIDNTNLARLSGTGADAQIVPEMKQFAGQYGFKFVCHEKGHSNRKAGNERGFYTVETNFFPGREFSSLEDINQQAFEWATKRMAQRPAAKTDLIPIKAFEYEKVYLKKILPYIPAPYLLHERGTDQYGFAAFSGNFYWIPGTSRHEVTVLEYSDSLKIYYKRKLLGEYDLPVDGTKNLEISPNGQSKPSCRPRCRRKPTVHEEKSLRAAHEKVDIYLNFALKRLGGRLKHKFIRQLYSLHGKMALSLFVTTISRAKKYRITDINTIERIAILQMKSANYNQPYIEIDDKFKDREAYLEGRLSEDVDLSIYGKMIGKDDDG